MSYLAVALGGSLGAMLRYYLWNLIGSQGNYVATIAANIIGCFLLGVLWVYIDKAIISETVRLFLMVGVLGSMTTFSTFSLELLLFWQQHEYVSAVTYFLGSVIGSVFSMLLAIYLFRLLLD